MIYKKVSSKPVVELPLASKFKERVALELKFYKGKILLHMTDHATRLSVTVIIPSNEPIHIVTTIMKYWVSLHGTLETFVTDNGSEFINNEFMTLRETLNINVY